MPESLDVPINTILAVVPNGYDSLLRTISTIDPKIITLFSEKLTTGSQGARKEAARILNYALERTATESVKTEAYWGTWAKKPYISYLRETLLKNWHYANVLEECNGLVSRTALERSVPILPSNTQSDPDTDVYWQGQTMIAMVDVALCLPVHTSTIPYWASFVDWAGTRKDIRAVVAMAIELESVNPVELESAIDSSKSLSRGAL